jgi:hypothetical protein
MPDADIAMEEEDDDEEAIGAAAAATAATAAAADDTTITGHGRVLTGFVLADDDDDTFAATPLPPAKAPRAAVFGNAKGKGKDIAEAEEEPAEAWSTAQDQQLLNAQADIDPCAKNFWVAVAKQVMGKDAAQCYARVFEGHPTPGGAGGGGGGGDGTGGGAGGAAARGRGATMGQAGARQRMRDRRWEQRADEIENYEDDAFAVFQHDADGTPIVTPVKYVANAAGAEGAGAEEVAAAGAAEAAAAESAAAAAAAGAARMRAAAANESACVACGVDDDDGVQCDGCDAVFHTSCAGLAEVPEDDWFCQLCAGAGVAQPGAGVTARAAARASIHRAAAAAAADPTHLSTCSTRPVSAAGAAGAAAAGGTAGGRQRRDEAAGGGHATRPRPAAAGAVAELQAQRRTQQNTDGYIERWLKKRGGQAAARPGTSKGDTIPAAAAGAAGSEQVREDVLKMARTADPAGRSNPYEMDDGDNSDYYFSGDD